MWLSCATKGTFRDFSLKNDFWEVKTAQPRRTKDVVRHLKSQPR